MDNDPVAKKMLDNLDIVVKQAKERANFTTNRQEMDNNVMDCNTEAWFFVIIIFILFVLFVMGLGLHFKHDETKGILSSIEKSLKRIEQTNNNYMGELK